MDTVDQRSAALRFFVRYSSLLMIAIGLANGCSSPESELANVEGTVKLHGKPVSRFIVTFLPADQSGTWARGITNLRGQYSLKHQSGRPGVEPGEYKVTFRVAAPMMKQKGNSADQPTYSDPATTPHRANVAGGGATLDFDLTSL